MPDAQSLIGSINESARARRRDDVVQPTGSSRGREIVVRQIFFDFFAVIFLLIDIWKSIFRFFYYVFFAYFAICGVFSIAIIKYFNKIKAPMKGFYTFNQSAHTPLLEEPEKMNKILLNDVKNLRADLADKN